DDAILELSLEGVPLPLTGVGDTNRIKMAIVEQFAWAIANASQDVAHRVAAHLVEAEIGHASTHGISNRAKLAVVAGDGNEVAQELYHGIMVLRQFLLHSALCFADVHKII